MSTLLDEIWARCPQPLIDAGEHGQIAALVSAGRTRLERTEIGHGLVLATLGLQAGNALLDVLTTQPDYRYVKPLLEQGRLDVSQPLARDALDALAAAGVLTQAQADALKALAEKPAPVSVAEVVTAMEEI